MEQLSVFQIRKMDQERLWLGLPLAMVPGDTLPSEKTVLRAFKGFFDNSEKIGCLLLKDTSNVRWRGAVAKPQDPAYYTE